MGLETASFLADLNAANPLFNDQKNQGDDHIRLLKAVLQATFPGFAGRWQRMQSKQSAYTVVLNDNGSMVRCTAALTLSMAAAATLGNGHAIVVDASGGDVTIDPNGTELINGSQSFVIPQNHIAFVWCDGSAFTCCIISKGGAAVQTISTDITLTSATLPGQKEVTAQADITLPAAGASVLGQKVLFHSSTTRRVRVIPTGSNTIEGLNQPYRIPSWTTLELMCISTTGWIVLRAPGYFVGELVPSAVAQNLPGFVPADFGELSRTTYAGLFDVIGTTFDAGDGSTTFRVPDTRARMLLGEGEKRNHEQVPATNVNTTSNVINCDMTKEYRWITGMRVHLQSSGSMPGGITAGADYYVRRTATGIALHLSAQAAAQATGTVDITSQGSGTLTITEFGNRTFVVGERGGFEDHYMDDNELAAHSHSYTRYLLIDNTTVESAIDVVQQQTTSQQTGSTGDNAKMRLISPHVVCKYYIKT